MRFGLQIPNFTIGEPGALFDEVVDGRRAAEETGYDSVWVMDHFYQLPPMGGPDPADARRVHAAGRAGRPRPRGSGWVPW